VTYHLFGNTNVAFRVLDLCILAVNCSLIYRLANSFFRSASSNISQKQSSLESRRNVGSLMNAPRGYIAVVFFLGYFLFEGTYFTLQRDSYIQMFLLFAIWIAHHQARQGLLAGANQRAIVIGLLLGCAAVVKPNILLFAPLVWGWLLVRSNVLSSDISGRLRYIAALFVAAVAGGVIPAVICLLWLTQQGSLNEFITILRNILPLYAGLDWDGQYSSLLYVALFWTKEIYAQLLLLFITGGAVVVYCLIAQLRQRTAYRSQRAIRLLFWALFTLIGFFYVFLARKFFDYHWFPMIIGMAVFTSILPFPNLTVRYRNYLPLALVTIGLWSLIFARIGVIGTLTSLTGTLRFPRYGAVEAFSEAQPMIDCLDRLTEADSSGLNNFVQLLGNTAATPDLALRLRQPLATRFFYDVHFYVAPENVEVQKLRAELLQKLQANPPAWIIDTELSWPYDYQERVRSFPALYDFIGSRYQRISCENTTQRTVYPLILFGLK